MLITSCLTRSLIHHRHLRFGFFLLFKILNPGSKASIALFLYFLDSSASTIGFQKFQMAVNCLPFLIFLEFPLCFRFHICSGSNEHIIRDHKYLNKLKVRTAEVHLYSRESLSRREFALLLCLSFSPYSLRTEDPTLNHINLIRLLCLFFSSIFQQSTNIFESFTKVD